MLKFKVILPLIFIFFLKISSLSYGSSIYLKESKISVPVKSYEIGEEKISVTILKGDINTIQTVLNSSNFNSDTITLKNGDTFSCKIIETFENTILAEFKKNLVTLLPPKEKKTKRQNKQKKSNEELKYSDEDLGLILLEDLEKDDIENNENAGSFQGNQIEKEMFKEIKKSLFEEIKSEKEKKIETPPPIKKSESHNDMLEKIFSDKPPKTKVTTPKKVVAPTRRIQPKVVQNRDLGMVKGKILKQGNPLTSCRVRLVSLRNEGGVFYKDNKSGKRLEITTDKNGTYIFYNVSPGYYKLYWMPPSETSWIRRVSMEPDVFVEAGEVSTMDSLETDRRILN